VAKPADSAKAVAGRVEPSTIRLHGHEVSYRLAGQGPLIVLVHGITSRAQTWRNVIPRLAERHTVLAPDLLGHGRSAKPRGDYSLGAYASGIRDLLVALGHDRATFVGHSLGGGVAMQLSYQFPELCERLVLVSSGGLGPEVHLALRAAALPGSEWVLPIIAGPRVRDATQAVGRMLGSVGLQPNPDVDEFARGYASLADREAREAFVHTLRAVIDPRGQRVSARDRLYLAAEIPTLIVWGERDRIIPARHGRDAHEAMPGSRLELLPAGHFPHLDQPQAFANLLADFIASTEPAHLDRGQLRSQLLQGGGDDPEAR
jgi:pimeloyl-ACP methyl ester carboxylesterase